MGRRASTVEFNAFAATGERSVLMVEQHSAFENEDPCDEANEAVMELVMAVQQGDHPLDEVALVERDEEGFLDVYDWRTPGALEQAMDAWAPYLPRHVVSAGVHGLASELPDIEAALPEGTAGRSTEPVFCQIDPTEFRVPASLHDMMEDGVLDMETTGLGEGNGILRF